MSICLISNNTRHGQVVNYQCIRVVDSMSITGGYRVFNGKAIKWRRHFSETYNCLPPKLCLILEFGTPYTHSPRNREHCVPPYHVVSMIKTTDQSGERLLVFARFMGPTWGPPGADRTQVGPMLAPWILLCGLVDCIVGKRNWAGQIFPVNVCIQHRLIVWFPMLTNIFDDYQMASYSLLVATLSQTLPTAPAWNNGQSQK